MDNMKISDIHMSLILKTLTTSQCLSEISESEEKPGEKTQTIPIAEQQNTWNNTAQVLHPQSQNHGIMGITQRAIVQQRRTGKTMKTLRYTSHDLEFMPEDETKRYEIVDGELYVSRQPHYGHQSACLKLATRLTIWSEQTGLGDTSFNPGLIYTDDNDVVLMSPGQAMHASKRFTKRRPPSCIPRVGY